jgi:TPR repeat protein
MGRTLLLSLFLLLFALSEGQAVIDQTQRSHPRCSGGGPQAEELFLMGLRYANGMDGFPRNVQKAIQMYEESLALGNPKAAINLGTLYRTAFVSEWETEPYRYEYMNALYERAIELGCPDGYYFLAQSYAKGWGKRESKRKSDALIMEGLEAGSYICMFAYGYMLNARGEKEEAKKWMHRALDGGFFGAATDLSIIYEIHDKDYPKAIEVLRQGAKLGGWDCLFYLYCIYMTGVSGSPIQPKDDAYAACLDRIRSQINLEAPPPTFDDLDTLCPPPPVVPYPGK